MDEPTYTITITAFEAGVIMGMLEEDEKGRNALPNVHRQLITLKERCEEEAGVVKTLLPNGMLEIRDDDGNLIIRPPYSWEISRN